MLKQSTTRNLVVFMTDSTDHVTGKTGLTLTITASKDGAAFASITPTVTELETGWYKVALTAAHTDTLGDIALHVVGTGADPTDLSEQVFAALPGESVTVASIATSALNAAAIAADAVTEIQAGMALSAQVDSLETDVAAILARVDVATSSRLASAGYIAAPSAQANADALLGRSVGAGADGGRMVKDALRALRNKTALAATSLTIYEEDDTTPAWTATVTTGARDPIASVDPA